MVRTDDGMLGVVEQHEGEPRIIYTDRGERFVASKQQKWTPWEPPKGPMREEEKLAVAHTADRVLRSLVEHVPAKLWTPIDLDAKPFDEKLVRVICDYLSTRT